MPVEMIAKGQGTLKFATEFFFKLGLSEKYSTAKLAGATIEVQWMALKATLPDGTVIQTPLPLNSNAVIKGMTATQFANMRAAAWDFLGNVLLKASPGYPPPITAKDVWGTPPTTAKDVWGLTGDEVSSPPEPSVEAKYQQLAENMAEAGFGPPMGKKKATFGPIKSITEEFAIPTEPVALAEATMLGQPVKGSNEGSIYRVIALGPRVKMAARLKGFKLSVRVEGKPNAAERTALTTMGFTEKGGYLSTHFGLKDVPAERIIGCLFFNPDVELTAKIGALKELTSAHVV